MSDPVNNFMDALLGYTGLPNIDQTTNQATSVANTGSSATDLMSYTLSGGTLSGNQAAGVVAAGTFAANGNTKTVVLTFGGTTIATITGAFNGTPWRIDAQVYRKTDSTQISTVITYKDSPVVTTLTSVSSSVTTSSDVDILVTATGTATNDIVQTILAISLL